MITRAQAEALWTLAESLEACERVGVNLGANGCDRAHVDIETGPFPFFGEPFRGSDIRRYVSNLIPKTEREEYQYTVGPKGVTEQVRIVKPK